MHLDLPIRRTGLPSDGSWDGMWDGNCSLLRRLQADGSASFLVEALVASGLSARLAGPGPVTVLAPSNSAFADMLVELGQSKAQLLAHPHRLRNVLGCHLLAGHVPRSQLMAGGAFTSLRGEPLRVDDGDLLRDANGRWALLGASDVPARNGIVHRLDRVLLPRMPTLLQALRAEPRFERLLQVLDAARLGGIVSGPAPLTLLAPSNQAFEAWQIERGESWAQILVNRPLLTQILTLHLLPGRLQLKEQAGSAPLETLQGAKLRLDADLKVWDSHGRHAHASADGCFALNGQIHALDRVLQP